VTIRKSLKYLFLLGLALFALIIVFIPILSSFLHLERIHLVLLSPIVVFAFLLPVGRGALQGLQEFKKLGVNLALEGFFKLFFGALFVYIGLQVSGAVLALVISFFLPFIFVLFSLRKYLKKRSEVIQIKAIYKYSFPVLLSLLFLTALYSIDVVLVKHFFNGIAAGLYVAASLAGKVIFFASMAVTLVMFPKVTEYNTLKKPTAPAFFKST